MDLLRRYYLWVVCAVVALLGISLAFYNGWFSDKNFYTVTQQSSSGKVIDGWIVQGAPKVKDGIYAFTIYSTTFEKRIPVQGTVVTKVGRDWDEARKMLASERFRHDPDAKFTGF